MSQPAPPLAVATHSLQDLGRPPLLSASSFASATPISFERYCFAGPAFSSEDFLADRRHIELDRLKAELQQALRDLKTELVELINLDYADFINLSTKLVGVDTMIADLARPLETINAVAQSVRDSLADVIFRLEDELEKRAVIREKKLYIQLFISIHESIEKLDALLQMSKAGPNISEKDTASSEEGTLSGGKLIERVANEYSQLQYLISKANKTPFVQKIEKRISRIKATLTSSLSKSLTAAYKDVLDKPDLPATRDALSQILRTYVSVDRVHDAESIFENSITMPFLRALVTRQNLTVDSTVPVASRTGHPLQRMYEKILKFVRNDCAEVIVVTRKTFHGTAGNLLVNALWVPIATTIIQSTPFIFNPGIPEVFHENFSYTMRFLENLEKLCRTRRNLEQFRSHPATVDFMKRWQLSVYFQIRVREIATDLEDTLSAAYDLGATREETEGLILPPSGALIVCVNLCWDDKVFLRGLSHRFWKLTLQLIARYVTWVQDSLSTDIGSLAGLNESTSPNPQDRPLPPLPEGGDDETLRKFLHFYHDIRNVSSQIIGIFETVMRPKLPQQASKEPILRTSLDEALAKLHVLVPELTQRVCSVLIKLCSEPLRKNVQEISPQYRMTRKEAPTKHSYFVPSIFAPLSSFFDNNQNLANSSAALEWTTNVADNVAAKYLATISAVLQNLKVNEDFALSKAKKPRRGGGSAAVAAVTGASEEALSDFDKIRLQLYFDVQEFGRQIDALGSDSKSLTALTELKAAVQPFEELVRRR
ncbi:oligomeric golgi complex component, COG2-domain-containing protein [Geranomyces variabilis]|nr:oligomeric golgi complex component, COG2-domain-containing protein [Geranomyces variabilis]KAJ3141645.1 Conserved oligomeric Golgi complex subunit 2 [Geranomyces variabilis]